MLRPISKERFIEKAKKVHGDKYDYSKVEYVNCKKKVCIICPEHGEFWQTPDNHIQGKGCPVCRYLSVSKKNALTLNEFILRARRIHGDKYDYSKVEYVNNTTPVCIICPEHGEFWQVPTTHLDNKCGCSKCSHNYRYKTEEFLEIIPTYLKEKYDFSKFVYESTHKAGLVICPKHGEFFVTPHNLRIGVGCPRCTESKLEEEICVFLNENNIEHVRQYTNDGLFQRQKLDFYLPKYNLGIECQGRQHFYPVDFGGKGIEWAENQYKYVVELDKKKQELCKKENINLIYYTREKDFERIGENPHFLGYDFYFDVKEILHFLEGYTNNI